ncbi:Energy-coupling factor transporter transmembrane protein EcfT [subsurface metagenome]
MPEKSEFELFVKLSIGQYMPTGSVMHRLDPRVKLLLGILLIGACISSSSLIALMVLFLAVILGLLLTRVRLRLAFTALRHMIIFLLVLALIQVFAVPQLREGAVVIWHRSIFKVTDRSLISGILLVLRFAVIVLGLSLFSFSTSTTELMHGIEHLLRPFQKIRFPAHELALTVNISIRFLPILIGEAEWLMKAQASRGADFGRGKRNFIRRIRKTLPLFVPLFIISLKHAQNLIEAMESRCYMGGKGRTHLIRLHAELRDYFAFFLSIAVVSAALFLSFAHIDKAVWRWISAQF